MYRIGKYSIQKRWLHLRRFWSFVEVVIDPYRHLTFYEFMTISDTCYHYRTANEIWKEQQKQGPKKCNVHELFLRVRFKKRPNEWIWLKSITFHLLKRDIHPQYGVTSFYEINYSLITILDLEMIMALKPFYGLPWSDLRDSIEMDLSFCIVLTQEQVGDKLWCFFNGFGLKASYFCSKKTI